ncbi:MAG: FAD:protein FMN transferase [Luteolibacter sp.]
MRRFLIITVLAALTAAIYFKSKTATHELHGTAMGTTWSLAWRGKDPRGVEKVVNGTLQKWENVLSQWKPESDLSRANHGEAESEDLKRVIALAEEIQKASAGAFDPRLLKETSEAGFGPEGTGTDLSGIGKGFAVDRVGEMLRRLGITDFIFELGGEVLVGDGEWEVEIESPDPATRTVLRKVKLNNRAMATSGNYRQFQPAATGLASHIIDPKTGKPVISAPSSVSVIAKDCATADAWATALFVLGPDVPAPPGTKVIWNKPKLRD